MAEVSVIKLRVRRGSDADRRQVILDNGELGFVTDRDSHRLVVGDAVTYGGHPIGSKLYTGSIGTIALRTALQKDVVYNTEDRSLYALTGTDYLLKSQYQNISPKTAPNSINVNKRGQLAIQSGALSANNIHTTAFDKNYGFKEASNGKVQVNNDNSSVKISSIEKKLYVDPSGTDWSATPTAFTEFNKIWTDPTAAGIVRVGPPPGIYPIELNLTWNTCGRVITAFLPGQPIGQNEFDRPRINTFRTDGTYLTYMSAGYQIWDPITAQFYTPWGDRSVGSFGQTIILDSPTLSAGVDVFVPIDWVITLNPNIAQWTATVDPLVPEERKYQLLFNIYANPVQNISVNFC
jgi:hypothetical protein